MTITDPDDVNRVVDALAELMSVEDAASAACVLENNSGLLSRDLIDVLEDAARVSTDPEAARLLTRNGRLLEAAQGVGGLDPGWVRPRRGDGPLAAV